MPNSMPWTRIVVSSDIMAGRSGKWIAIHRHHDRALLRSIQQKLSEDLSSIFQLGHVIGRPKPINLDVIIRVKEIAVTNHRISSGAISQAIRDARELLSISSTTVRIIRRILGFFGRMQP
jgi:hypothetical protein